MQFVLTDSLDFLLHFVVRESQQFLNAMRLGDDGLRVELTDSIEQGVTGADHVFGGPVVHKAFVQDRPIPVFPVLRNEGMSAQNPFGGVGTGEPFAPDVLQYSDTGLLNVPVLMNFGLCRILVFGLVDLLIVRKNRDVDDDSIRFAPSMLILIISLMNWEIFFSRLFFILQSVRTLMNSP